MTNIFMKAALAVIVAVSAAAAPAMAQNSAPSQAGPYTYQNGADSQGGSRDNFAGPNRQAANCTTNGVGTFTFTTCN